MQFSHGYHCLNQAKLKWDHAVHPVDSSEVTNIKQYSRIENNPYFSYLRTTVFKLKQAAVKRKLCGRGFLLSLRWYASIPAFFADIVHPSFSNTPVGQREMYTYPRQMLACQGVKMLAVESYGHNRNTNFDAIARLFGAFVYHYLLYNSHVELLIQLRII